MAVVLGDGRAGCLWRQFAISYTACSDPRDYLTPLGRPGIPGVETTMTRRLASDLVEHHLDLGVMLSLGEEIPLTQIWQAAFAGTGPMVGWWASRLPRPGDIGPSTPLLEHLLL